MDPSSRESLLNTINKVSRYRQIARFLFLNAQKIPVIRNMRVVPVSLPRTAFHQPQIAQYSPGLSSAILRCDVSCDEHKLHNIRNLLKIKEAEAEQRFADQTLKTLTSAKVHAEVQLIYYIETSRPSLSPRVVYSSKDACYLCNMLVGTYGKLFTPRSHGRLYPGWRLLCFAEMTWLQEAFNQALEQSVKTSIKKITSKRQSIAYPFPNESRLSTLLLSASTLNGPPALTAGQELLHSSNTSQDHHNLAIHIPQVQPSSAMSMGSTRIIARNGDTSISHRDETMERLTPISLTVEATPSQVATASGDSTITTVSKENSILAGGESISRTIALGRTSQLHSTGSLGIQIEYPIEPHHSTSDYGQRRISYKIQKLTAEAVGRLRESQAAPIIDVRTFKDGSSHSLTKARFLYFAAGESVLRIEFSHR
ncbi:hypothetical protein BX600DRAFT_470235 [Xylariales sp. PMI_506]|nr:hypothetical protein BX600DRAFT_470235 [Xylariales sp. PMI_506]